MKMIMMMIMELTMAMKMMMLTMNDGAMVITNATYFSTIQYLCNKVEPLMCLFRPPRTTQYDNCFNTPRNTQYAKMK